MAIPKDILRALPKASLFSIRWARWPDQFFVFSRFRLANCRQWQVGPFCIIMRAPWLEKPARALHPHLFDPPWASDTRGAVAIRYDFDGDGYSYIDRGSGPDWMRRHPDGQRLYVSPLDAPRPEAMNFEELIDHATRSIRMLSDWAHMNETNFTGWGDGDVPPAAEFWRVKADQAAKAIAEIRIYHQKGLRIAAAREAAIKEAMARR